MIDFEMVEVVVERRTGLAVFVVEMDVLKSMQKQAGHVLTKLPFVAVLLP